MTRSDPLDQLKVHEIMSRHVICVSKDDPLPFVIKLFERTKISGAPVVNKNGEYVGVISKTDLTKVDVLKVLVQNVNSQGTESVTIKHFMNPVPPITVPLNFSVRKTTELMVDRKIHRVFVTNPRGEIVGVVSSFDIVKIYAMENSLANLA
jgi:CBS domain-containing protein